MKKMIVILIAGVVVGITISGLYKHFVTDRIMDGGGMENEFANAFRDGDTLKSIRWSQSASNYGDCFHFDLEETDGAYTISGWCIDTEGSRERGRAHRRAPDAGAMGGGGGVPAGELASAAHGLAGGGAGP